MTDKQPLALAVPLGLFIALALAAFVFGAHRVGQAEDPFIGRQMPCGHFYQGRTEILHGARYYFCEEGDAFPQRNRGGLLSPQLPEGRVILPPPPPLPRHELPGIQGRSMDELQRALGSRP